jgi:hypothetical protein
VRLHHVQVVEGDSVGGAARPSVQRHVLQRCGRLRAGFLSQFERSRRATCALRAAATCRWSSTAWQPAPMSDAHALEHSGIKLACEGGRMI